MRATIPTAAFLMLVLGCGGRTLLDDPNDQLVLVDAGRIVGSSGGEKTDGGKTADGGSSSGASSSSGSSSGGSSGTISCGTQTCDTASEDCCTSLTGMASASCVAKGKCTGVVTQCAGSLDCGEGEVCCGTIGGTGGTLAGGTFAGGTLAGGTFAGGTLAGGTAAGGTFAGGTLAGGTFAGGTLAGGTAGTGGFSITVQCARSCTGGFQLCTSNSDCSQGVTCQATMFGAKLCGGLGGVAGGTFGGGALAGGTAAGGTAAGGTAAGGTFAGGTFAGGLPGGADGGFGGFFGGLGGFAGGGGIPGH